MSIGVLVDVYLRPGGVEVWLPIFEERFRTSRQADGCEEIYIGLDRDDPLHLVLVEKWASVESHARNRERVMAKPVPEEAQALLAGEMKRTFVDDLGI
jgi:quinol monooxygenase YgiN